MSLAVGALAIAGVYLIYRFAKTCQVCKQEEVVYRETQAIAIAKKAPSPALAKAVKRSTPTAPPAAEQTVLFALVAEQGKSFDVLLYDGEDTVQGIFSTDIKELEGLLERLETGKDMVEQIHQQLVEMLARQKRGG